MKRSKMMMEEDILYVIYRMFVKVITQIGLNFLNVFQMKLVTLYIVIY